MRLGICLKPQRNLKNELFQTLKCVLICDCCCLQNKPWIEMSWRAVAELRVSRLSSAWTRTFKLTTSGILSVGTLQHRSFSLACLYTNFFHISAFRHTKVCLSVKTICMFVCIPWKNTYRACLHKHQPLCMAKCIQNQSCLGTHTPRKWSSCKQNENISLYKSLWPAHLVPTGIGLLLSLLRQTPL